jgi:hypothetical protein
MRIEVALPMQSHGSIAAIGGIFVILALFVVLGILAAIAELVQFGRCLGGISSREYIRAK